VHGGYTQQDVMEVARALSGWTVRSRREVVFGLGKVEFHPEWHDDGEKRTKIVERTYRECHELWRCQSERRYEVKVDEPTLRAASASRPSKAPTRGGRRLKRRTGSIKPISSRSCSRMQPRKRASACSIAR